MIHNDCDDSTSSNSTNNKNENDCSSEYVRAHLIISGKVQGVFFRKYTQDVSIQNDVNGWVRNLDNGNVESVLEGSKSNVDKVIEWCHRGPPNSVVQRVDVNYEAFTGNFDDFKIIG